MTTLGIIGEARDVAQGVSNRKQVPHGIVGVLITRLGQRIVVEWVRNGGQVHSRQPILKIFHGLDVTGLILLRRL